MGALYNSYSFCGEVALVYNVRKQTPIKPRELGNLLYGNAEALTLLVPEDSLSTQMTLHSPGDIIYYLENAFDFLKNNWMVFFGLLVFIGGGKAFSCELPGLISIIKDIINAPSDIRNNKASTNLKELEVLNKRLEIYQKIQELGIKPETLGNSFEALAKGSKALQVEPIILDELAAESVAKESANELPNEIDEA